MQREHEERILVSQLLEPVLFTLAQKHLEKAKSAPPGTDGEMEHSLGTIVMVALYLEARINSLCIEYLLPPRPKLHSSLQMHQEEYLKQLIWHELEHRKNLAEKWEIFLPLITPTVQILDDKILHELRWLKDLRNRLAHYKARPKPLSKLPKDDLGRSVPQIRKELSKENAERAVRLVKEIERRIQKMGLDKGVASLVLND